MDGEGEQAPQPLYFTEKPSLKKAKRDRSAQIFILPRERFLSGGRDA